MALDRWAAVAQTNTMASLVSIDKIAGPRAINSGNPIISYLGDLPDFVLL